MTNYNVELYVCREYGQPQEKIEFDVFQFPGGELQLRDVQWHENKGYRVNTATVYARGADPYTLITAALVLEFVRANIYVQAEFTFVRPYLPAARSDRGREAALPAYNGLFGDLSIHHRYNFMVSADIHNAKVLDTKSHSDGTPRYEDLDPAIFIQHCEGTPDWEKYDGIIAPDEGAKDRSYIAGQELELPVFYASKSRNFETGKLLEFRAPEGLDPTGTYLVLDDICDGGGTFAGLASEIKKQYGGLRLTLDLWVTHGVFSGNWEKNLFPAYRDVYTTNSHPNTDNINHPRVHVIDIKPLLIG